MCAVRGYFCKHASGLVWLHVGYGFWSAKLQAAKPVNMVRDWWPLLLNSAVSKRDKSLWHLERSMHGKNGPVFLMLCSAAALSTCTSRQGIVSSGSMIALFHPFNYQLPNDPVKAGRRWGQRHPQGANLGSNGILNFLSKLKQWLPPAHPKSLASQCMSGQPISTCHALTS